MMARMAEPYLERLSHIIEQLGPISAENVTLEARHFFSGAALFANGKICASLSPAGFAVKLPAEVRQSLLDEGKGKEFRFFAKGPIKREYILLSDSFIQDEKALRELINTSVNYVVILLNSNTEAVKE
jgi:TfoX/Sxy family transcriptional regulator of competence genes